MESLDDAVWPPPPQQAALSWFMPKLAEGAQVRSTAMSALMTALDVAPTLGVLVRKLDDDALPPLHRWRLLAEILESPHFTSDAFRIRKDFDFSKWVHSAVAEGPLLDATAARFYLAVMRRDHAKVPWLLSSALQWAPEARSEVRRETVRRAFEDMLNAMVFRGHWSAPTADETVGVGPRLAPFPAGVTAALLLDVNHASEADLARLPGLTKAAVATLIGQRPIATLRDMVVPRVTPAKILALRPWLAGVPLGAPSTNQDERATHARLELAAGLWSLPKREDVAVEHFRAALALDPAVALQPATWMRPADYEAATRLLERLRVA